MDQQPTHRCTICGSKWIKWPATPCLAESWSLFWGTVESEMPNGQAGKCCDNVAMGDQIVELYKELPDHVDDLTIVTYKADDVPGQWLAHCLDLDLMAQADSMSQALSELGAIIEIAFSEPRAPDEPDPFYYGTRTPPEDWQRAQRKERK